MPLSRPLRVAAFAPLALVAVGLPLGALAPLAATAAATPTTLAEVAGHVQGTEVYIVPGYDGPAIDASAITADIDEEINGAPKDPIRVVALPSSIAAHYEIGALPALLEKESGFTGDLAVLTRQGFRATDADDATQAFEESKSKGATAIVQDWVSRVQIKDGLADGTVANPGDSVTDPSSSPVPGFGLVIGLFVVGLLAVGAVAVVRGGRRRRQGGDNGFGLDSLRRRARADLNVLQAEYTDHDGTDASVQATIDSAAELITTATTTADLRAAESMIAAARNQLNPGRVSAAAIAAINEPATDDGGDRFVVNRAGHVRRYGGSMPFGYQLLPAQYYGSVVGGNLTDVLILEELFGQGGFGGGPFGGFGGGFGGGPFDGGGNGFGGPGNGDQSGMGGASGGGDWGGGAAGGGDFGGGGSGSSGGGNW